MTENKVKKIGGLLLAAGSSRRLGSPKQLLDFKGKTLLRRATEALVGSACSPIIVILGAEIEGSKAEIGDLNVSVVINEDWQTGMSSSIRKGLEQLLFLEPDIDAAMITLCDQPFVTAEKVGLFIEEFNQADPLIVAARYNQVLGVPALFSRQMFSALFELDGDKGARELIRQTETAVPIDLPEAATDIDTTEVLDSLGLRLKVPL
jgi:molybdenum cofactor cytidylyltransferase